MFNRRSALFVASLLALSPALAMAQPAPQVIQSMPQRAKKGLFSGFSMKSPMLYGYKGAGIRMATQQRAARKAKSRAQNKRNHR